MDSLQFRSFRQEDAENVAAISKMADPFGWTRQNFLDAQKAGNTITLIELDGTIIGYSVLMQTLDEAELLEISIVPEKQGMGYGKVLLNKTLDFAKGNAVRRVFLEVRESNLRAGKMYASRGFSPMGRRKDYYKSASGREDAVTMVLEL